jgi:hypothetical protein
MELLFNLVVPDTFKINELYRVIDRERCTDSLRKNETAAETAFKESRVSTRSLNRTDA